MALKVLPRGVRLPILIAWPGSSERHRFSPASTTPGIAAIYGIEEAEGTRALVLELVEGPTLADRIKQGPIPIDEALPIAKQYAGCR